MCGAGDASPVRMQGWGRAGERRPLCKGVTQWRGGDRVGMDGRNGEGRNETPRTGRGVFKAMYDEASYELNRFMSPCFINHVHLAIGMAEPFLSRDEGIWCNIHAHFPD